MKAKYPAIVYHYSDASTIQFPNFMGCMSQTPDDETPNIETIINLAQQVLKGFLHGEDINNLPNPYSIKEPVNTLTIKTPRSHILRSVSSKLRLICYDSKNKRSKGEKVLHRT